MSSPTQPHLDPRAVAGIDLIGRTGAADIEMRWAGGPEDDQVAGPVVWTVVATYSDNRYEADAASDPVQAIMRLCERLIDGGKCVHCGKPTSFVPDMDTSLLDAFTCVTAWDPELSTFRRGCEAEHPKPNRAERRRRERGQ